MDLEELKNHIRPFISEELSLEIPLELLNKSNGKSLYNKLIKQKVQSRAGVYIWFEPVSNAIVYIGMAGKIKNNGSVSNHSLPKRLTASRGKDKSTNKDILTQEFLRRFMKFKKIELLDFHIFYACDNEPASYIESIALYYYFKRNKKLPELNNSF